MEAFENTVDAFESRLATFSLPFDVSLPTKVVALDIVGENESKPKGAEHQSPGNTRLCLCGVESSKNSCTDFLLREVSLSFDVMVRPGEN